jgi:hypothetical protein
MNDETKTPLTEEQQILQEEQEVIYMEGQSLALKWMRARAHEYTPSQKNADLLRIWIGRNRGGVLSVENLEEAFQVVKGHLETVPAVIKKVELPTEPKWSHLTMADIRSMSREEYKENLKHDVDFRAALVRLGIQGVTI